MIMMASTEDILAKLAPEERAVIEAQLKAKPKAGYVYQHVSNPQKYNIEVVEGKKKFTPSGEINTNALAVAYQFKPSAGSKRYAGVRITRSPTNKLSLSAYFPPISTLTWVKDKLAIVLEDTFNKDETNFINTWLKQKYSGEAPKAVEAPPEAPSTEAPPTATKLDMSKIKKFADMTGVNIKEAIEVYKSSPSDVEAVISA